MGKVHRSKGQTNNNIGIKNAIAGNICLYIFLSIPISSRPPVIVKMNNIKQVNTKYAILLLPRKIYYICICV